MQRSQMHQVAVGAFCNQADAQRAMAELKAAGFSEDEIGVVAHDPKRRYQPANECATHGASRSAWPLGIVPGMLPDIGPVVTGGVLKSILSGAAGGLTDVPRWAFEELGMSDIESQFYDEEFRVGRTVVAVCTNTRIDDAVRIMRRHNSFEYDAATTSDRSRDGRTTINRGAQEERRYRQLSGMRS